MLYAPGSDYVVRESPYYRFENPTSEGSSKLPLDHFSQTMVHWHFLTNYRPNEKSEEIMIARLIDFMRWTRDTVHEETGRSPNSTFVHNFNSLTLTEARHLRNHSAKRSKTYASATAGGGCGINFSTVFNEKKTGGVGIHKTDSIEKFTDFNAGQTTSMPASLMEGDDLYWDEKKLDASTTRNDAQTSVASTAYRNRKGSVVATTLQLPNRPLGKSLTPTYVAATNIATMKVSSSTPNI